MELFESKLEELGQDAHATFVFMQAVTWILSPVRDPDMQVPGVDGEGSRTGTPADALRHAWAGLYVLRLQRRMVREHPGLTVKNNCISDEM